MKLSSNEGKAPVYGIPYMHTTMGEKLKLLQTVLMQGKNMENTLRPNGAWVCNEEKIACSFRFSSLTILLSANLSNLVKN